MYDVITERLKLKDVIGNFPKSMADVASQYLKENPEQEFIRKGLTADDLKLDVGSRTVISHITTSAKDRDDEIVDPKGAMLKDYNKHRVVLWGHDHRSLPIAVNEWIKTDDTGLVAKTRYASKEANPFADQVFLCHQEKIPIAKSIGFIPLESIEPKEGSPEFKQGVKRIFTKWILLEYSDVPVPSNPEAINIAVSKGLISEDEKAGYGITIVDKEPEKKEVTIDDALLLLNDITDDQTQQVKELIESFKEPEEKRADLKGNPSVSDIFRAIDKLINPIEGRWDNWVVDLFPKKYPSGHVIIENNSGNSRTFKQFDYTFDDGIVTLSDKFIELEEGYKPKGFLSHEEKAGRVLSGKNRTAITNAVRAMGAATVTLNQLLSDTEKPPKPDDDDDDDKKDFITIADEPEPDKDIAKQIEEGAKKALKGHITEIIQDVFKRQRGKV